VKSEAIKADYQNGVLTLSQPGSLTEAGIGKVKLSSYRESSVCWRFPVYPFHARKRTVELLKEGSVIDTSSVWRTAYISSLFEKDGVQLALRIAEADAAIDERLNSSIEIGAPEHEAILAARQALTSLKAQHVSSMVGETLM
jgi:hypothetical protein